MTADDHFCSVVDPHHIKADPDQNSTSHPEADPDSEFYLMQ